MLIGGAPSTGSSVLVQTLNRHSRISAGPETFLFIHPLLYTAFNEYKKYLIKGSPFGGLKSIGWFRLNGALLLHPFYEWKSDALQQIMEQSASLPDFAERYFKPALKRENTDFWVEKSPSNVLAFAEYLKCFSEGKVLLTVRNPYDNVASLIARGYDPFYATASVLLNNSFGMRNHTDARFHLVRYENLIENPQDVLKSLCHFAGVAYEPKMLEPEKTNTQAEMEGWTRSERGAIKPSPKGRFESLPELQKSQIKVLVARMYIREKYAHQYGLNKRTLSDICAAQEYPFLPNDGMGRKSWLWQKGKDWLHRSLKLYPTGFFNYPVALRNE
ncbi:MAG: sulfotransferase [Bacteroidetes bacterium]|nr:sulfotransferase [Bacteroidota bacterium]